MGNELEGEPEIVINGSKLTPAQSMAVRVALNHFYIDLEHDGLGDDIHGKKMTRLYKLRISEIQNKMMQGKRRFK